MENRCLGQVFGGQSDRSHRLDFISVSPLGQACVQEPTEPRANSSNAVGELQSLREILRQNRETWDKNAAETDANDHTLSKNDLPVFFANAIGSQPSSVLL